MDKIRGWFQKLRLTLLFASIVFIIMFLTLGLVLGGRLLLRHVGILHDSFAHGSSFFLFALVSLVVGTFLAMPLSSAPLGPLRAIMEAADKIADGDYSVRLHLRGPKEFRQLNDSFNHMAEELGSVEMLSSDFVNNFSHEFKTPIISIRGFAKILKYDDLPEEERQKYLDIIVEESERLADLAANVLSLSRIEQQSILTDKKRVNISEQIRLVIAMLDSKWPEKHMDFSFDCDETCLYGNEELLQQVWINLLDNAIKFSPDYGKVEVKLTAREESVEVSFTNQGENIPPETAAHIFDKFYQGDTSHATKGNGLGLAIAQKIAALHKGRVYVAPSPAGFVTFTVELPA